MKALVNFFKDEDGVTAIEYGLIAALIAVTIIAVLKLVGNGLNTIFGKVESELNSAGGGDGGGGTGGGGTGGGGTGN